MPYEQDSFPQPDIVLPSQLTPAPDQPESLSARSPRLPWTLGDVGLLALLTVCLIMVSSAVVFWIAMRLPQFAGVDPQGLAKDTRIPLAAQALAYAALFTAVATWLRIRTGSFWRAVRWNWPQRETMIASIVGGMGMALIVGIASKFLPIPKELPVEQYFRETRTVYLLAFFGTIVAPFMEELFYRGLFFPALRERMTFLPSALISSVLFAAIHGAQLAFSWAPLLVLSVVGFALAAVRERSGSLAAAFLVHAGYNGFLFIGLFVVTKGFRNMEVLFK